MTRAEFIKEAVKQLFNVEMDEISIRCDDKDFIGCWGFKCPSSLPECEGCPYKDFWEKEV